jgi:hypothetical protein
MRCKCGKEMNLRYVWDSGALEELGNYAYNLYACDVCGRLLKEDVWDEAKQLWIGLSGVESVIVQVGQPEPSEGESNAKV